MSTYPQATKTSVNYGPDLRGSSWGYVQHAQKNLLSLYHRSDSELSKKGISPDIGNGLPCIRIFYIIFLHIVYYRTSKYLKGATLTRSCAIGGFFVSIPLFLIGKLLLQMRPTIWFCLMSWRCVIQKRMEVLHVTHFIDNKHKTRWVFPMILLSSSRETMHISNLHCILHLYAQDKITPTM